MSGSGTRLTPLLLRPGVAPRGRAAHGIQSARPPPVPWRMRPTTREPAHPRSHRHAERTGRWRPRPVRLIDLSTASIATTAAARRSASSSRRPTSDRLDGTVPDSTISRSAPSCGPHRCNQAGLCPLHREQEEDQQNGQAKRQQDHVDLRLARCAPLMQATDMRHHRCLRPPGTGSRQRNQVSPARIEGFLLPTRGV